jgi:uncharacterized ferritin-like protein (DUF455 family)
MYKEGKLKLLPNDVSKKLECPKMPNRPKNLTVVDPKNTPERKMSTIEGRIALIHSLCHMESYAIDLSWDIISRFSDENIPKEFYEDWLKVATDEARHWNMLQNRLVELGSFYGALPVHEGLWESAERTSDSLLVRLVILHCVHEARGLDTTPKNIQRLKSSQDKVSATVLQDIYEDEITHVEVGLKWFQILSNLKEKKERMELFYKIVKENFNGILKPPFNKEARGKAGMDEEWYIPLSNLE